MTPDTATLTTKQFAEAVGCPQPTVHAWVSRGLLTPCGKRGKSNLFDADDIDRMREYRAANPSKRRRRSEPSPVMASAVVDLVLVDAVEASGGGHRYWTKGEIDESIASEIINFGPIPLGVVRDNTADGQSMVPQIDPDFEFDAGEVVVLANALDEAETTWVWGPSGAGKSSGIAQICAMLNWPLYRVNMSADFTVSDFVGGTKVTFDEDAGVAVTEFIDGMLINAMLNGGVLLIDEVTATPAGVLMALQAVLERASSNVKAMWAKGESHTTFVNTEEGGEVIHAHPRFRIMATDNTNGQGDITGAFAGTNVMNEAFRSRFTQWIHKGFPDEITWTKIVAAKAGIAKTDARRIVRVAIAVNDGSALLGATKVTNQTVINPRDTLAIARLFKRFGSVKVAFRIGLINSMHSVDGDRQFVKDLLDNIEED